jgi:uncharacterized coiled-coil protein SlyX
MDSITQLEEHLAHLALAIEDLSDQMRAQWDRIEAMERRLAWLAEREAERLRAEGAPPVTTAG